METEMLYFAADTEGDIDVGCGIPARGPLGGGAPGCGAALQYRGCASGGGLPQPGLGHGRLCPPGGGHGHPVLRRQDSLVSSHEDQQGMTLSCMPASSLSFLQKKGLGNRFRVRLYQSWN